VKPETAAYLEKARVFLNKARGMLANEWPDESECPDIYASTLGFVLA